IENVGIVRRPGGFLGVDPLQSFDQPERAIDWRSRGADASGSQRSRVGNYTSKRRVDGRSRLRPNLAVDCNRVSLLEVRYRGIGRAAKVAGACQVVAELGERELNGSHRRSLRTETQHTAPNETGDTCARVDRL